MRASSNDPFGSRPEPGAYLFASILLLPPGEAPEGRARGIQDTAHQDRNKAEGPSGKRALPAPAVLTDRTVLHRRAVLNDRPEVSPSSGASPQTADHLAEGQRSDPLRGIRAKDPWFHMPGPANGKLCQFHRGPGRQ